MCSIASLQPLFVAVLLATGWLFRACSRLRRVRLGYSKTVASVGESHRFDLVQNIFPIFYKTANLS